MKNFKDFIVWIIRNDNNKKLTIDDYKNKINEIFSRSAEDLASSAEFQQDKSNTYNSILSLGFIDSAGSTLRDNLFTLAKIINFIELIGNNDSSLVSEKGLDRPLDTEIIFPSKIFEDDVYTINQYEDFENFIGEKQGIKTLARKLQDLKSTRRSLTKIEENQLKVIVLKNQSNIDSKTLPVNGNTKLNANKVDVNVMENEEGGQGLDLILTEETLKSLDDISKITLNDEDIPLNNISISSVIHKIGKRIKEVNFLLYPKIGKRIFKDPEDIIKSINDDILNRKTVAEPMSQPMNIDPWVTADIDTVQKFPPFVSGIGDLKKVKDKIVRYTYGEIAHVENILTGELKERIHKKLTKTEETITVEEKTTEDITNHLESTERFELKKASNEVIETENKIDFGVKITAGYGPFFEASSYFDMGIGSSTKESNDLSSTYSKNVIDKSISKIQSNVRKKSYNNNPTNRRDQYS